MDKLSENQKDIEYLQLVLDNLFRIFQVKSKPNLDKAIINEFKQAMDGSGYHKNCKIT